MAARELRLESAAAMIDAIGKARVHFLAAEMEVCFARMAHRPAADAVIEIEQAGLAGNFRARLGRHEAARRGGGNWSLLVTRTLTQEAARANRDNPRLRAGGCARHRL